MLSCVSSLHGCYIATQKLQCDSASSFSFGCKEQEEGGTDRDCKASMAKHSDQSTGFHAVPCQPHLAAQTMQLALATQLAKQPLAAFCAFSHYSVKYPIFRGSSEVLEMYL